MITIGKRKTHEEFIEDLKNINPNIISLDKYINAKTKIRFKCITCNHIWYAQPSNILSGCGCPQCAGTMKKTHEQFVDELKLINKNIVCLDRYINAHTKIRFKCLICEHVWMATPNSILSGNKCPECNLVKSSISKRKSHEQFVEEVKILNPNISILGKYVTAKERILCKCNTCGFEWSPVADSVSHGYGCPKCYGRNKTTEEFKKEIYLINPDIEILNEYINSSTMMQCKCKICGHMWKSKATNLRYSGCPVCKESHGEKKIRRFLLDNNIEFVPQKTYNDLIGIKGKNLSYDFYIPTYNLLIEFQGEFHDGTARIQKKEQFKIQQEHDRRKKEYAKLHNITLLEIWYYDIDNIEEILNKTINNLNLESVETVIPA